MKSSYTGVNVSFAMDFNKDRISTWEITMYNSVYVHTKNSCVFYSVFTLREKLVLHDVLPL